MALAGYSYEDLIQFLDSDDTPPEPLTRRQIREEVQRFDRERADEALRAVQQQNASLQEAVTAVLRLVETGRYGPCIRTRPPNCCRAQHLIVIRLAGCP